MKPGYDVALNNAAWELVGRSGPAGLSISLALAAATGAMAIRCRSGIRTLVSTSTIKTANSPRSVVMAVGKPPAAKVAVKLLTPTHQLLRRKSRYLGVERVLHLSDIAVAVAVVVEAGVVVEAWAGVEVPHRTLEI